MSQKPVFTRVSGLIYICPVLSLPGAKTGYTLFTGGKIGVNLGYKKAAGSSSHGFIIQYLAAFLFNISCFSAAFPFLNSVYIFNVVLASLCPIIL